MGRRNDGEELERIGRRRLGRRIGRRGAEDEQDGEEKNSPG